MDITRIVPAIASYQTDPGFRDGALLLPNVAEEASQVLTARALQLAGIDTFDVIRLGREPVGIEDLTFSSFLKNCNGPSLFLCQIFDRMVQRVNQLDEINKLRSIYICRTDSKMRRRAVRAAAEPLYQPVHRAPRADAGHALLVRCPWFEGNAAEHMAPSYPVVCRS